MSMSGSGQKTVDVEERLRFDEKSLERFLSANVSGFQGTIDVKKFGSGESNPTYFVTTSADQKYVLRKKPPGKLLKSAHAVEREFRVMKALGNTGFEVPQMHILCEDDAVIGTPFYIMEFVKGRIVDNGLKKLSVEERGPAMFAIVDVLANLHNVSPVSLGLLTPGNEFGQANGFYERQIKTLSRVSEHQSANSAGSVGALEAMADLLAQFAAHMPEDRSCVIHGDWKPDNVILSEHGAPKVLAILDWELSTIGHPLSDLANMCLPYHLGPLGSMLSYGPFDLNEGSGIPSEEDVHKAYCKATGVPFPIPDWTFCIAFSCFRLGVIAQGVAMRSATGQASQGGGTEKAQGAAMVANELCNIGLRMMNEQYGTKAKL